MDTQSYKSVFLNKATVNKEWVVIDATDLALGRLAARVALVLRGKTKAGFTPNVDCGDNVIVINAEKVALKGKKMTNKVYTRYTGYPGGQRTTTAKEILRTRPTELVRKAVKGKIGRASCRERV